jgi:D-inositol-3-phosphate glycosyltransferase
MNVYVRELSSAIARLGHDVDVYTRRDTFSLKEIEYVEPGFRVHHILAGPPVSLDRDDLTKYVGEFTDTVARIFERDGAPDAIHANYWLSGLAGHRLKHELNIPLIMTFHTLERVKADTFERESDDRAFQEAALISCADAVLASCDVEAEQFVRLYNAEPARVHVVPLGVEHAFFAPGYRPQARRALGLGEQTPLLLFVGRLQELKGVDLALDTLIELRRRGRYASLAIVGGPSGPDGGRTLSRLHERVAEAGAMNEVIFVAPQSHRRLSTWMRAADVTVVPSRAESFGLVALESSACGTPVVASDVGGLPTIVVEGVTGYLVRERNATHWADAIEEVLDSAEDTAMSNAAVLRAGEYTWKRAGESLASLVRELSTASLAHC